MPAVRQPRSNRRCTLLRRVLDSFAVLNCVMFAGCAGQTSSQTTGTTAPASASVAASQPAGRPATKPKTYSDLLLVTPYYWFEQSNWPYPPWGHLVIRDFANHRWVKLEGHELSPRTVGPGARKLLVYDRRSEKYVFYDRDLQRLETFTDEHIADLWIPEEVSANVRRNDDETVEVRLANGEWKRLSCFLAWESSRLPAGQVLAVVANPNETYDLCVWEVASDTPARKLATADQLFTIFARPIDPSPSYELALVFQSSLTDLILGWRYRVVDLDTGEVVDRFAYNFKGGDHIAWIRCSKEELEAALAEIRQQLDERLTNPPPTPRSTSSPRSSKTAATSSRSF